MEIAKIHLKDNKIERALKLVQSHSLSFQEKSIFYLEVFKALNNKSEYHYLFYSIQYYIFSIGKNIGEYSSELLESIINVLDELELNSDLIDLVPKNDCKSPDYLKVVEALIRANEIEQATGVNQIINDESYRFYSTLILINNHIKLNNFEDVTKLIHQYSSPILKLNLCLEVYVFLLNNNKSEEAIAFLEIAIDISSNLTYYNYSERLLYSAILIGGNLQHLNKLKFKLLDSELVIIGDFLSKSDFKNDFFKLHYFELDIENIEQQDNTSDINHFDESNYFESTQLVIEGTRLLASAYGYDEKKADYILKIILDNIKKYDFEEDHFSELAHLLIKKNIQTSDIGLLLKVAEKIKYDSYNKIRSNTFFEIFKYGVLSKNYELCFKLSAKIIIDEIKYDEFLSLIKLIIDDDFESTALDLVCFACYNEKLLKDSFLNKIILHIYSTQNKIPEYIFNLFNNDIEKISAQGNLINDIYINGGLVKNELILLSQLSPVNNQLVDSDFLTTELINIILTKNINFDFTYFISSINDSKLCNKIVFKIIESYINLGISLEKIINFIQSNHAENSDLDQVYSDISKLFSSYKRFDDAIELAKKINYSLNDYKNTLRSDTISIISIDLMKSGNIEKAIQTSEIIDNLKVQWLNFNLINIELINLFNKENYNTLERYIDVINEKRYALTKRNINYYLDVNEMNEILSPNLAYTYSNMLDNYRVTISKDIIDKIMLNVLNIEKSEFVHAKYDVLFKIGN